MSNTNSAEITIPNNVKTKPPFTNLHSFHVAAFILSYYGYHVEIINLLQYLSTNSRNYFRSHKEFIKAFITTWVYTPTIDGMVEFGSPDVKWSCRFPHEQMIKQMP